MNVRDRNTNRKARVVIIDSEFNSARLAAAALDRSNYDCEIFPSRDAALKALESGGVDVIVADMNAAGVDGVELLKKVQTKHPDAAVVISVPTPAVETAKAAVRNGAFDFVGKPYDNEELNTVVARAVEMSTLQRENRRLREQLDVASVAAGFVAESASSRALVSMIRRVAPARTTVLVEGETGTGKELVARMLHYWSTRAEGPFVAVNCKAFADGVVESELFGHEKGSFTGAIRDRAGCFERASTGTLFLDEIGEAGPDFQAKLLRVLEDGEVMRVGANKPRKVDVRIVAATNRRLRDEVAAGRFRADLYFRLNVIPIKIAPLRDRPEDVIALARHFLTLHSNELGRTVSISPESEAAMYGYAWPGNVRELENVIERGVVMSGADVLEPSALALEEVAVTEPSSAGPMPDLAASISMPSQDAPNGSASAASTQTGTLQETLDRAATDRIKGTLAAVGGNRNEAATLLGVDRTTLYRLMKRLGI